MRMKLAFPFRMVFACVVLCSLVLVNVGCADDPPGEEGHPHAEAEHAEGEHAEGVPLDIKTDLAIWSFVVFLVFVGILKKFAWGPMIAGLDKREGGIRKEIDDARAAHEKAKALLAEHEYKMDKVQDEVREILAEARRDSDHTRTEMIEAAQAESEAMKNRAVHEIERARDEALDQLFTHMADSVAKATEEVLGRSISAADDKQLIDDALSKFSPSQN